MDGGVGLDMIFNASLECANWFCFREDVEVQLYMTVVYSTCSRGFLIDLQWITVPLRPGYHQTTVHVMVVNTSTRAVRTGR